MAEDTIESRLLEIAHVLFTDIVAYSKLPMAQQERTVRLLQGAVRGTSEYRRAQASNQLITLPTGDGIALVFFGDPESAVRCAQELVTAIQPFPELKLRIGIHTGPVHRVTDINANRNVTGGGINIAQRVMDCGDAGHVLLSKTTADILLQLGGWQESLHDLGEVEVKHGVKIHLHNFYRAQVGNRIRPQKLRLASHRRIRKRALGGTILLLLIAAGVVYRARDSYLVSSVLGRRADRLGEQDVIVLADFANSTSDPVFDDALKQALSVALRESPFLNVLSDSKVAATLKLMIRTPATPLTPEVAKEVCLRAGSKAYVAGSIAPLGNQFVIGVKAIECHSGDTLAEAQTSATAKEKTLDALGEAAAKLRNQLGESRTTVEKFDVPLMQATTSSLEALQALSQGARAARDKGAIAALPFDLRAIELDSRCAMCYRIVGADYVSLGEVDRSREFFTKAFELRERTSEKEKLIISAEYYRNVTGEIDKSAQVYQQWIESYPRDGAAYVSLGVVYSVLGEYAKATEYGRKSLEFSSDSVYSYVNLTNELMGDQKLEEARKTVEVARSRKLDDYILHNALYGLAFIDQDATGMQNEVRYFVSHPAIEDVAYSLEADTAAYFGKLHQAHELTQHAIDSAIRADNKENASVWQANLALREADVGDFAAATKDAAAAHKLAPNSPDLAAEVALVAAMSGDFALADTLAKGLAKRMPLDLQMQKVWLPTVAAQIALAKKDAAGAVAQLQPHRTTDLGTTPFTANLTCLYPVYVRGQAYLANNQPAEAATEFQQIVDRSGLVWNCSTGAMSHLGLARAYALQARAPNADPALHEKARSAYKDFLHLWKDADSDIPIFKQAKAEAAKLK